ncbi:LysR family transcriptional regulator [Neotabrizicola sp. VNH66]|uniref:LysR family transcriptional regulator n=1 Tax=Neotabrizicola sp. VNH66 TaxID=3400918 RepID=UPI003C091765
MRHLESETLAVLIAVAETRSFTTAAERLGKTQAAVSMCIARTEEKLQKRLFERTRHGAIPTAVGQSLIGYARKIVALEAEALSFVSDSISEARVRLGMPDDYLSLIGNLLLHKFAPQHRAIYIDLTCDFSTRLHTMVDNGQVDIALAVCQIDARPKGEILFSHRQLWCTGPSGTPETEDVLRLALFSEECSARPRIAAALERHGRPWRMVHSSSHLAGLLMAVASGRMLTVLPECAVPSGWRIIDPVAANLPVLPESFLTIVTPENQRLAVRKIAAFLQAEFTGYGDQNSLSGLSERPA